MAELLLANNAYSNLAAGIASGDLSLTVTTGQGARFPTISGGDWFYVTLQDAANNIEIVKVTARTGDSMTIERAQESTTARAWNLGDVADLRLTAGIAAALRALSKSGSTLTSLINFVVNGNLSASGNVTLGDAAGDTLTINGTAVSIPNGLNFDSNTLFIDSTNNRVGFGTATPAYTVDVSGAARITSNVGIGANFDSAVRLFVTGADSTSANFAALFVRSDGQQIASFRNDHAVSFGNNSVNLTSAGNFLVGTTTDSVGVRINAYDGDINTGNTNAATDRGYSLGHSGVSAMKLGFNNTASTNVFGATAGSYYLGHVTNHPTVFTVNAGEAARITSARYFKASNTGTDQSIAGLSGQYTGGSNHAFFNDAANNYTVIAGASNPTGAHGYGSFLNTGASGDHFRGILNNTLQIKVAANGDVTNSNNSYGAISDPKLKDIIGPKESTWEKTKDYEWIEYTLKNDPEKKKLLGLNAEQARKVSPGVVGSTPDMVDVVKTRTVEVLAVLDEEGNELEPATTRKEKYTEKEPNGEVTLSVQYSVVGMQYYRAFQEAQHRIEALESQNAQLTTSLSDVLQRLTTLESK